MAADFDAGSIEGTLDLDTDPFVRGLLEAKARAEAFEHNKITKRIETKQTADVDAPHEDATLGLDDSEFKRGIDEAEVRLRLIGRQKAEPKIKVDTSQSSAALAALNRRIDQVAGTYSAHGNPLSGAGGGGHGLMYLLGLAAALAPAFGPATAAVGLFGAAGIAAFGGAAVSLALYGKVMGGTIEKIQEANKAGKTLTGWMGLAQTEMRRLGDRWEALQKAVAPGQARLLVQVFESLYMFIPKLIPLIDAMSKGLSGAFKPISNLMASGQMERFIRLLSSNAIKDLPQIGKILANGLRGLMGIFTALNPIIQIMLPTIVRLSREFEKWARFKSPTFFNDLFDKVQKYGPQTLQMFSSLGSFLVNIARAMAPLTGPALDFLTHLADSLAKIDFTPLTSGIGDVMQHLAPFADIIGTLVNTLLPPLGTILSTIGDSFIGPLGDSLAERLNPALQVLADVLDTLAPYLGDIISSFADLVNPTGVALFTALIEGLAPVVKDLAGPLSRLVVALEGFVDVGLETITPAILPLAGALDSFAKALAPLIDGLAWFLSHETVAQTILGIAGAVKAMTLAMAAYRTIMFFVGAVQAFMAISAAEGILAGIAAVSPAAAAGMTAFGVALDFALGPIGLIILAIAALAVAAYLIHKHWDKIGPWLHGMWEGIKKTFSSAVSWIGDKLGDLGHAISSKFSAILSWVKSHWVILAIILAPFLLMPALIAKNWGRVSSFLSKIPGWVKGVFSSAAQWLVSAGRNILVGLWNGITDRWNGIIDWIRGIGGLISGAVGDLSHALWSAGWSIISGLADGIRSAISSLNPAGIVSGMLNGIKGLGPHSPAKWGPFSGSGWRQWTDGGIMRGLAKGLRAATPEAIAAAREGMEGVHDVLHTKTGLGVTVQAQQAQTQQALTSLTALLTEMQTEAVSNGMHIQQVTMQIRALQTAIAALFAHQNAVLAGAEHASADKIVAGEARAAHTIITKLRSR